MEVGPQTLTIEPKKDPPDAIPALCRLDIISEIVIDFFARMISIYNHDMHLLVASL